MDWRPLSNKWASKVLSEDFYIKDTLGDGNCQFRAIAMALGNSKKIDHIKLRRMLGRHISKMQLQDFRQILHSYVLEQSNGEFDGGWDPASVKSKKEFIEHLTVGGFHFQGDNTTLALLSKVLKVDFVIFDESYNITDLTNPDNPNEQVICLYYANNHYQPIGLKRKGKMQTLFKRSTLPQELITLLDKQTLLIKHVKHALANISSKPTLNKVLQDVQSHLGVRLGKEQKQMIFKIMRNMIDNENFLQKVTKKRTGKN